MNGIEFRNVTKRYGADKNAPLAVKGISFEVPVGTLTTILGPSGCGKTTTLRVAASGKADFRTVQGALNHAMQQIPREQPGSNSRQ